MRKPSIVIGPSVAPTSYLLASTCHAFGVPFISIGSILSPRVNRNDDSLPAMLTLQPPVDEISKAFADLLNMTEWKSLTVIYDRDDGNFYSSLLFSLLLFIAFA